MLRFTLAVIVVCSVFYAGADACSSVTKDFGSYYYDPIHSDDQEEMLACNQDEVNTARCLNGGTCFAVALNDGKRDIGCSCTEEWTGRRCELLFIDPEYWADEPEHPLGNHFEYKIAGIAIGGLLVLQIIIVGGVILVRRRSQKKGNEEKEQIPIDSTTPQTA